ncbi:MAG: hypothetical protein IT438_14105 [Phycisphaerales bacterium]|nr:hypothetical protein [Phycisphaerales bacterium]
MRVPRSITSLALIICGVFLLMGCESGKGLTTMGEFSGGTVTFGKLVTNIPRVGEDEPTELSVTIHNQVVTITGKYLVGGVVYNADYDLVFGPYPPNAPNIGEIKIVNSGSDNVPEIEIISGYAAVGGACPVVRAPGNRNKSTGTQFAVVVSPGSGSGNYTTYVIFRNQTGSEDVLVSSTASGGPSQTIPNKEKFCKVTVVSNTVTAIDPPKSIDDGDAFVKGFYDWVKKMMDSAALRN